MNVSRKIGEREREVIFGWLVGWFCCEIENEKEKRKWVVGSNLGSSLPTISEELLVFLGKNVTTTPTYTLKYTSVFN